MADFFKQLIAQLSTIWQKLSLQQKIITASLVGLMFLAFISLMVWSGKTAAVSSGYKKLYTNLETEEAALMTEKLTQSGYKYKISDGGKTIEVEAKKLYEARMALAKEGLPKSGSIGYEIFDKTNLGTTDFVQKLNAKRALEGELQRTIEGLEEVKAARVHIVIPEKTIFLDKQKDAKASVVIKTAGGTKLTKEKVRAISHLVSSSVDGLKTKNISIVDFNGNLLSNPYGDDETALLSSRNMELQQNIERSMEHKVTDLISGILGPGKAKVQIAVDLDFDQVENTIEKYNPESKVVRSEERNEENIKNAPDGDRTNERSLTNYEIDKTVEHIIKEVGNIKRLTISVAVDGIKSKGKDGKEEYTPRTAEEIATIEDIVKNAVGYDLTRGDRIVVANMKFDNDYLKREQDDMNAELRNQRIMNIVKMVLTAFIAILFILVLRSMAKSIADAMNPPLPKIELGAQEIEEPAEVPEDIQRSNELLERIELMTQQAPVSITSVIKEWIMERPSQKQE